MLHNIGLYPAKRDFKMVYCAMTLKIMQSISINHFGTLRRALRLKLRSKAHVESPTNPDYVSA
jgi:hypothetical protein